MRSYRLIIINFYQEYLVTFNEYVCMYNTIEISIDSYKWDLQGYYAPGSTLQFILHRIFGLCL